LFQLTSVFFEPKQQSIGNWNAARVRYKDGQNQQSFLTYNQVLVGMANKKIKEFVNQKRSTANGNVNFGIAGT